MLIRFISRSPQKVIFVHFLEFKEKCESLRKKKAKFKEKSDFWRANFEQTFIFPFGALNNLFNNPFLNASKYAYKFTLKCLCKSNQINKCVLSVASEYKNKYYKNVPF